MKKNKTPDGERISRALPFSLTDTRKAEMGTDAAKFNIQIDKAVEVKKAEVAKHTEKIKNLTSKRDVLLSAINDGFERREVSCTEVKNFDANKIEYWYEGEVLESREMTATDRQTEMKIAKPKSPAVAKWQRIGSKMKGKPKTEEETESDEIAKVHRLETSKKGASSMVDPV